MLGTPTHCKRCGRRQTSRGSKCRQRTGGSMRRILGWVGLFFLAAMVFLGLALPRPSLSKSLVDTTRPIKGADTTLVRVQVDSKHRFLDLVVGPIMLASGEEGHRAPIQMASVPVSGWVQGFSWFVSD